MAPLDPPRAAYQGGVLPCYPIRPLGGTMELPVRYQTAFRNTPPRYLLCRSLRKQLPSLKQHRGRCPDVSRPGVPTNESP